MRRLFKITPKRIKRLNNQVLTPEMEVTVTMPSSVGTPFLNGEKEIKAMYMRLYGFDYQKCGCHYPCTDILGWCNRNGGT